MKNLLSMEKTVLEILENSPLARADDYVLMWLVSNKLKPEITEKPFADVMYHHKALGLPNWETVTRCRRKIQRKHPELQAGEETTRRRYEQTEKYKAYAKAK